MGGVQTVTVATLESRVVQELVTRHQYEVVAVGDVVRVAEVPPATGEVVVPLGPAYHWYAMPGRSAAMLSAADWPD